jgi:hypothetical protein
MPHRSILNGVFLGAVVGLLLGALPGLMTQGTLVEVVGMGAGAVVGGGIGGFAGWWKVRGTVGEQDDTSQLPTAKAGGLVPGATATPSPRQ